MRACAHARTCERTHSRMCARTRTLVQADFRQLSKARAKAAAARPASGQREQKPATPTYKSVEAGAATQLWAATARELEGRGALYESQNAHGRCWLVPPLGDHSFMCRYCVDCQPATAAAWAADEAAAAALWELTEQTLGVRFAATAKL